MIKKTLSIFVAVAFVSGTHAALYLEESFPYTTGNLGGQGGWNSGSACQVVAGSLSVAGLESPTITSNKASLNSSAGTALKSFNAAPITSGSVYLSFILRQTTLSTSTTGGTVAGLDDDGTVTTSNGRAASALGIHIKQTNSTTYLVGIRKAQGTSGAGGGTDLFYTGDSFITGETVFVVAKYTFGAGAGDDTVSLWVNPATNSFGGIEPTASIAATNTGNTTDAAQLQHLFLRANSSTTSGINEIDDVRVGSTWADVTPAGGVVQPPVTNSQPRITQTFFSAGGLVLRGTNGVTNGVYQVLSSTTVAAPMTNWPAIATNLFDASGNFDSTNPVSIAEAQRFFRILVGGQIVLPPGDAPAITTQPTNITVLAGQTASFIGAASGTAPLAYQWFFNTTTLANGASVTYTITNAQAANEGSYTLRVTNSAGAVTSVVATLTVNVPPTISTQPQSQIVTVSNTATFNIVAAGDAPLSYQWYFNSAPILNGTNANHAISSALTNNAGNYFVMVTNNFGAVTSSIVTLTVNPASGAPDFRLIGFATLSGFSSNGTLQAGGTTGGAGGIHVQVWTALELANHLQSNATLVIQVMTNIDLGIASLAAGITQPTYSNFLAAEVLVRSHKTLYSTNGSTLSHGTLRMGKPSLGAQQNIIIRNLKFTGLWEFDPSGNYDSKGWDYIHLEEGSHHVWVDHCDFDKVYDGIVDVVHASDYVTVSWCVFRDQKKCSLVGHSNGNQAEDSGHLNVTFHHNYYVNVDERLPRMRFGNAHVFNLYCEDLGGNGIQSTCEAATLVENSYFYHPVSTSLPTREENGTASGLPNNGKGFLKVLNSTIVNLPSVNVQFRQFGETNFLFNAPFVGAVPPYPYTLDATPTVPNIVTNWSGVNKVTNLP